MTASVLGVRAVGRVRARWAGHRLEGDVTITVDGTVSVEDGHRIARRVNDELRHGVRHLDHVVVHVHPAYSHDHQPVATP